MNTKNREIAQAYYIAMGAKDVAGVGKYLHPDVQFASPLTALAGKEAVLEAITGFMAFFTTLTIRSVFGSDDQAMIAYDVEFPAPFGKVPTAALLKIQDGLITKVELIFDARPFDKK